jgi:hypothetical protein
VSDRKYAPQGSWQADDGNWYPTFEGSKASDASAAQAWKPNPTCATGHEGQRGDRFCRLCGLPVVLRCPNSHEITTEVRFCRTCGVPVQKAEKVPLHAQGDALSGVGPPNDTLGSPLETKDELDTEPVRGAPAETDRPVSIPGPRRPRRRLIFSGIAAALLTACIVGVGLARTGAGHNKTSIAPPVSPGQANPSATTPTTNPSPPPSTPDFNGSPTETATTGDEVHTSVPATCSAPALSQALNQSGKSTQQVLGSHYACNDKYAAASVTPDGSPPPEGTAYYRNDGSTWTVLAVSRNGVNLIAIDGMPQQIRNHLDQELYGNS